MPLMVPEGKSLSRFNTTAPKRAVGHDQTPANAGATALGRGRSWRVGLCEPQGVSYPNTFRLVNRLFQTSQQHINDLVLGLPVAATEQFQKGMKSRFWSVMRAGGSLYFPVRELVQLQ